MTLEGAHVSGDGNQKLISYPDHGMCHKLHHSAVYEPQLIPLNMAKSYVKDCIKSLSHSPQIEATNISHPKDPGHPKDTCYIVPKRKEKKSCFDKSAVSFWALFLTDF